MMMWLYGPVFTALLIIPTLRTKLSANLMNFQY